MTVQVVSPPRRGSARSSAAQRAYQRRNQRAAQLGVDAVETRGRTTGAGRVRTRIPFVATIIALLGVGMAVTLLLTTRAAEDSYELSTARAYNESLIQQRAVLQRDVEAGNSAPVLALEAAKLGMIPTGQVARIVAAEDGSVRVVGDAVPAQGAPPAPLNPAGPRADAPVQRPLSGSAGAENPRPLSDIGEEPTPRASTESERPAPAENPVSENPVSEDTAPRAEERNPATPEPANVVAPAGGAEQLVPVSEMPQPDAAQPAEPEDGRP